MDEKNRENKSAPIRPAQEQQGKRPPTRAINEDDDGYDPYTDWHDRPQREPLFEEDPWK